LDDIGSVSLISSLSCISSGVGVTSGPLEVDVISLSHRQVIGDEVVLSGWVGLHDVSSLSSNVQVENSVGVENSRGSGSDVEHVRSILKGSSELRSVDGHGEVGTSSLEGWVLGDWRSSSVHVPVDESSVGSVSIDTQISGGNVVSDSESTVAVVSTDAWEN